MATKATGATLTTAAKAATDTEGGGARVNVYFGDRALLERVEREALRRGVTRSALVCEYIAGALDALSQPQSRTRAASPLDEDVLRNVVRAEMESLQQALRDWQNGQTAGLDAQVRDEIKATKTIVQRLYDAHQKRQDGQAILAAARDDAGTVPNGQPAPGGDMSTARLMRDAAGATERQSGRGPEPTGFSWFRLRRTAP